MIHILRNKKSLNDLTYIAKIETHTLMIKLKPKLELRFYMYDMCILLLIPKKISNFKIKKFE